MLHTTYVLPLSPQMGRNLHKNKTVKPPDEHPIRVEYAAVPTILPSPL